MTKLLFTCYISILLVITPDTDNVIDNTVVSSDKVVCVADNAAVSVDNVVVAADNITDDNISAYHVVSLLINLLLFLYISDNVVIASDDCVVILDHVIGILLFSSSFCCVCSFYLVTHIYSRYSVVCCFKYHLLSLLLFCDIFFSVLISVSAPV